MNTRFLSSFSTRGNDDCINVTFSFGFLGRNIHNTDRETVARCFTDKLTAFAQTLGAETVCSIDEQQAEDSEAAVRQAISDALDKVDPAQRAELIERYNLVAEGL